MAICIGNGQSAVGQVISQVDVDGDVVVGESSDFKRLKRQVTLQELAISSLEKENELLKKELREIKEFIYKKQ